MPRPGCPWPGLCVFKRLIHKGFRRLTLDGAQQILSTRGNKSAGGIDGKPDPHAPPSGGFRSLLHAVAPAHFIRASSFAVSLLHLP